MHSWHMHARIQRGTGGGGVDPALENHKAIGFHSNIGPDSLENAKAHSIMGHHRPTSRTPLSGADGGPLIVVF